MEVLGFSNVSKDLKKAADFYMSGYLIPGLLPVTDNGDRQTNGNWYQEGARVRGTLVRMVSDKGFGFIRVLTRIDSNLWINDNRQKDSPYEDVIVLADDLPDGISERNGWYNEIEFRLEKNRRNSDPSFIARDCTVIEL